MRYDPQEISSDQLYYALIATIVPRPIAWVSTVSHHGIPNLAPFSFFMGVASNPPTVAISVGNKRDGKPKDTAQNILDTRQFVINVVPRSMAEAMVETSAEFPPHVNEFGAAGVRSMAAEKVRGLRVVGSPAVIECSLYDCIELRADGPQGTGPVTQRLILGRVELLVVRDDAVDDRGRIDSAKLDPVARLGGASYAALGEIFDIKRPG